MRRFSEIGLDAGLNGKGAIQLHSGQAFRRRIQVDIRVRGGGDAAVTKPPLNFFHGNTIPQKKRGTGEPLYHNRDKSELRISLPVNGVV